jgi:hypothetical protein
VAALHRSDSERSDNFNPIQLSAILLDQVENLLAQQ